MRWRTLKTKPVLIGQSECGYRITHESRSQTWTAWAPVGTGQDCASGRKRLGTMRTKAEAKKLCEDHKNG